MLKHFKVAPTYQPGYFIEMTAANDEKVTLMERALYEQNYLVSVLTNAGKTELVIDPMGCATLENSIIVRQYLDSAELTYTVVA